MFHHFLSLKMADEDLKLAQMRKISLLIKKVKIPNVLKDQCTCLPGLSLLLKLLPRFQKVQARIEKHHEVLEIGCGWGSLAMEVVKRTGCKYTGITLSEEQLKYAEMRVKEAGLQVLIALTTLHGIHEI